MATAVDNFKSQAHSLKLGKYNYGNFKAVHSHCFLSTIKDIVLSVLI